MTPARVVLFGIMKCISIIIVWAMEEKKQKQHKNVMRTEQYRDKPNAITASAHHSFCTTISTAYARWFPGIFLHSHFIFYLCVCDEKFVLLLFVYFVVVAVCFFAVLGSVSLAIGFTNSTQSWAVGFFLLLAHFENKASTTSRWDYSTDNDKIIYII